MKRSLTLIALALVAALTLAACGNGERSTASSSDFNSADVTFSQSMIPHHRQAVEMAKLAQKRASSPKVKQLANKISAAQGPEIDTMTGWLKDWGKKVPSDSMNAMSDMPGMMSDADMNRLDAATGLGFDRMFLPMMMDHHAGAIDMAKAEQQDGKSSDAVELAKKIEAAQSAEISDMKRMR